ncbi:polyphenol oxidase I, chloroplastic-like [Olea europaea var. sylvestris]|uniref:polyphenol oxidase I, chloroplastic-like n=1 Tax=Olea europaea var. sylvestris TaxID=158386 RepID=UPI000C1D50C8|nr:polyphenol oxidase I, chloroplastic-like [Olea europaea var. sylvestris]
MPSLSFSWAVATTSTAPSSPSFYGKPSTAKSSTCFQVSCNARNDDQNASNSRGKFDRRNMLLGLGGIYGSTLTSNPSTLAAPIQPPNLSKCGPPSDANTGESLNVNCCPPANQPVDYQLPKPTVMRFRPAAHLVTKEYIAKYNKAIQLMKSLKDDDPRSFMQQASVHCAYCNGAYDQVGFNDLDLQVHNSWLFFPFHRWYLYFFERILGSLIGDPTFGLPFWNWDSPKGMTLPPMFLDQNSSLFNAKRNQDHLTSIVDLGYNGSDDGKSPLQTVANNFNIMYNEMVRNVKLIDDFMGQPYRAGDAVNPGAGASERGTHTAIHLYVGDPRETRREDLGNFYSAGRDPIFYCHHANVDRMWKIWRDLRGSKPKDFNDKDWLNASFVFYDENAQLVRVKVSDTLSNERMGYVYQQVDIPWLNFRPQARVQRSKVATTSGAPSTADIKFPLALDKITKILVTRPKKSRKQRDKEREEELLVIDGIEVETANFVKFDVFVNDEDDKIDELDKSEYVGTFAQVPHSHKGPKKVKTSIRLGLTELLEDLDVEDDDSILVSLVPRAGDVTIGGIKIIYLSI